MSVSQNSLDAGGDGSVGGGVDVLRVDSGLRVLLEVARQAGYDAKPLYEALIMGEIGWDAFRVALLSELREPYRSVALAVMERIEEFR